MQLIYIAGTDFCGSTFLDRLFWMVPGVAAPGELHWLLDVPAGCAQATRAGWNITRLCTRHGPACPALPPAFVNRTFTPKGLYREVATQLGCDVLVSSDKYLSHYKALASHLSPQVIVLFKTPSAQSGSFMKNEGRFPEEGLRLWFAFYTAMLAKMPDAIYVGYEVLAKYPNETMARLCSLLDLPAWKKVDPLHALDGQDYHHIGGNPGAHKDEPIMVKHSSGGATSREAGDLFRQLVVKSIR
jgi:hypothetical protein